MWSSLVRSAPCRHSSERKRRLANPRRRTPASSFDRLEATVKKSTLLVLLVLLPVTQATAETRLELLAPATCLRDSGSPNTCSFSFPGIPGVAQLSVKNGAPDGANRTSSATLTVNGQPVLGPAVFNQQVGQLELPIAVTKTNLVVINVAGAPGSYLQVCVTEVTDANAGAVIGGTGGSVQVPTGPLAGLTISIPAGAFTERSIVTVTEKAIDKLFADERLESVQLPGFSVRSTGPLAIPAVISYPVGAHNNAGRIDETTIPINGIHFYRSEDATEWERVTTEYNPASQAIRAEASHFSDWVPGAHRWKSGSTVYYRVTDVDSMQADGSLMRREIARAFDLWWVALDSTSPSRRLSRMTPHGTLRSRRRTSAQARVFFPANAPNTASQRSRGWDGPKPADGLCP